MLWLLSNCNPVLTDAAKASKRGLFCRKILYNYDETEWIELEEIGANSLVYARKRLFR